MHSEKWLIVQVAALGWDVVSRQAGAWEGFGFKPLDPLFPALTCTAQAGFRTALSPAEHGLPGNGHFDRRLARVFFWEQSASLVQGTRIWAQARAGGRRVGLLFWQQSLGECVDVVLSPKPIHKHHGGMIQDCYSQPEDLYKRLCRKIGRPFNLVHYWGPLAGAKSSQWIAEATVAVIKDPTLGLNVVFTYLPHLDYDLQRYGPQSPQAARAARVLGDLLRRLRNEAERAGWQWLFWGDYAMESVTGEPIFPNRVLREVGLFRVRHVRGRAYPDFYASDAVAVVDHQIAHVYARDPKAVRQARDVLENTDGIADVLDREAQHARGVDAALGGDLLVVAAPGRWFAYPWWTKQAEEPDYATHVDIHNKPGYDPCELVWGWPPGSVSRNPRRIGGTHGRVGPELQVAWASSFSFDSAPTTLIDLAGALAKRL